MSGIVRPKVVVLGMMTKMPVAGVVWQTMHYLLGFERMGYEAYYVEAHARTPSMFMVNDDDDASLAAAGFIGGVMDRFGLGDRWAFQALHSDGATYGLSQARLLRLYGEAALIINLHGGTLPRPEHAQGGKLIYLETDPVTLQVELEHGVQATIDFLEPHSAFFTFAENLGKPGCGLPVSERFRFVPTRQPVLLDHWANRPGATRDVFTTIANWRQPWREVTYLAETYHWSKHLEFLKFIDLPASAGRRFELALSSCETEDRALLESRGWSVIDGLALSLDADDYRRYITSSGGEFTVAKDQNVRLRSGWFSDRSATYLASGRPVITQDTAFGATLPTGEGLFAFTSLEGIVDAVERIDGDRSRHERAAREIAREYFSHEVVLGAVLRELGMPVRGRPAIPTHTVLTPVSRRPLTLATDTLETAQRLTIPPGPSAVDPHPTASVIIVTYENLPLTKLCLETVFAHTEPGTYELLIVDNGSKDGTREYLSAIVALHPNVRVICNAANRGFGAAVNQGLAEGTAPSFVLLNNDTLVAPGWLEGLLLHLATPSIGAVGPVTNRIGNEAQISTGYATFGDFLRFAARRAADSRGRTFEIPMLAMYCFAMRRDVYETIGPLDERYAVGLLEDDDYAVRLRAAGYRLLCAEDVFVHHFGEASFGHLYPTGEYHHLLRENRARYHEKWGVEWQPYGRQPDEGYDAMVEATRQAVHLHVPPGEAAIVISRGDERLVEVDDRSARHFPRDPLGTWAGHYPVDSETAVEQLREQLRQGARYLVIPRTSAWWLQHYDGLREYLQIWATLIYDDEGSCSIFRLPAEVRAHSHATAGADLDSREGR